MILALDIKTLIAVLVLGNAIAMLLLFFDLRSGASAFDRLFILARGLQCAAWTLIVLRGSVSNFLSFSLGNSVLFCGLALEGLCLLSLKRPVALFWRLGFSIALAVLLLLWWSVGAGQKGKLAVASFFVPAFYIVPASIMAFSRDRPSTLQKFIGTVLFACALAIVARGVYLLLASSYSLTVPTLFQVAVYLLQFLVLVLCSTGYILIRKEQANERLRLASEEKNLLLAELRHRVKNSLSIIASLTSLEAGRHSGAELRESLDKVSDRINAVAQLYELLVKEDPGAGVRLDIYLQDLVERLLSGYSTSPDKIRLELALESMEVDAKTSVSLGLIVNELTTNAMKFAFPGERRGRLRVALARRGEMVELEVSDDGVGLPPSGFGEVTSGPDSGSDGLGSLLVSSLVKQIGGSLRVESAGGTTIRVDFPAERG